MNKIPKNTRVVKATATDDDTVVVVLKSPCRHYSKITLKFVKDSEGETDLFITDSKNRCGIKCCASSMFK